jgi:hypothetical protein
MRKTILLGMLSGLVLTAMPGIALACDPNGPSSGFALGIPAADNPVWCQTTRPGYAMAAEPQALPGQWRHARRLRHRH